jgi:lysophospholipase L1-like esterase
MHYLADRRTHSFLDARSSVDIVCAGDSITGWNNFGGVDSWPFRTYPEFLQRLCGPSGLRVANCGIAGEVSPNGVRQVAEYLDLFPDARFFILGYGSNDLDESPDFERVSSRVVENLDRMVRVIRTAGRSPILLDVLHPDWSSLPVEETEDLLRRQAHHNERLRGYCREGVVPLVETASMLQPGQYADPFHPNDEGAEIIAGEVFRVLMEVRGQDATAS